jgi:DNA-binding beta-propeller fold protein YncE
MKLETCILFLCFAFPWTSPSKQLESPQHYAVTRSHSFPGTGSWGFVAVDAKARRVYVPHGSQLLVIDADSEKLVAKIDDLPRVKGIALAEDLKRGFTSNEGNNTVTIFNTDTLQVIKSVEAYRPDFILYDAFTKRVFPLHDTTTVIDGKTGDHVGDLEFDGDPENAVSDGRGKLYVNIADGQYVAVVDASAIRIVKKYALAKCTNPSSLALDVIHDRLFVGCENGVHIIEASSGRLVSEVSSCLADQAAFDPATGILYEACWNGTLSVIEQTNPNEYTLVGTVETGPNARTLGFDPVTKRIFLPRADLESVKTGDPTNPTMFKSKPDSFVVLVAEPVRK